METFADYLLNEKELINKMDILHRLQRMLREKKGINIFFNKQAFSIFSDFMRIIRYLRFSFSEP